MIETLHFKHLLCGKPVLTVAEAVDMAAGYRRMEAERRDSAERERRSKERGASRRAGDIAAAAGRLALITGELEQAVAATRTSKESRP